jgi:hypothetical protein
MWQFRPAQLAFIRAMVIPVGIALGFGWGAYQDHEWWGQYALGLGIFGAILLLPFIAPRGKV